jgi:hypothetical protein
MPGTVTVACRLPHGLHLELKDQKRVTIRGFSIPYGLPAMSISNGFALTPGVDADFFERWMTVNKDLDLVQRRLIFAHVKSSDAAAQAKEMADEKSGLEPLNPDAPGTGLERVSA